MSKITLKFYITHPDADVVKAKKEQLRHKLWTMKFADDSIHTGVGNLRIMDIHIFDRESDCIELTGTWCELFHGINYAPLINTFVNIDPAISLIKVYIQRGSEEFVPELTIRWSNDDPGYCKQCVMPMGFARGVKHAVNVLYGEQYEQQNRENLLDIAFQKPEYATITYNKLEKADD